MIGALDSTKSTDRDAVHLISAVIDALGLDLSHYTLSHTSLYEHRQALREEIAEEYRQGFDVMQIII